jgi:uncharacterized protein YndB with AHSA1/START domain
MHAPANTDLQALTIERLIDAPPEIVWRIWTERTEEWFCPKPWRVEILEQDLRPGGKSAMIMRGPDGEEMPMEGVFLEVTRPKRIVSTDAFKAGWEPQGPFMVAVTEFIAEGGKTRYRATARHWTAEAKAQHEAMGFQDGWGKVAEQLAELAEEEARG